MRLLKFIRTKRMPSAYLLNITPFLFLWVLLVKSFLGSPVNAKTYNPPFVCPATGVTISSPVSAVEMTGSLTTTGSMDPTATITVTATAEQQTCSDVTCLLRTESQTLSAGATSYTLDKMGCSSGACTSDLVTVSAQTTDGNCSASGSHLIDIRGQNSSTIRNLDFTFICNPQPQTSPTPTPTPTPTTDLKVNATSCPTTINIPHNTSASLNWTSTNASSCTASGNWSGTRSTSGTESTGNLTGPATYTYNLSCSGSQTDICTVQVAGPGTPSCTISQPSCTGLTCTFNTTYHNGTQTLTDYQTYLVPNATNESVNSGWQGTETPSHTYTAGTYTAKLKARENSSANETGWCQTPQFSVSSTSTPSPTPTPGTGGPTPTPTPVPPPPPGNGEVRVSFFNEDGITPYNGIGNLNLLDDIRYTDSLGGLLSLNDPRFQANPITPFRQNNNVCALNPYMDPGWQINSDGTYQGCPPENLDTCCTGGTYTCSERAGCDCQTPENGQWCHVYRSNGEDGTCQGWEERRSCQTGSPNDVCMGYNSTQTTSSFPRCFSPEGRLVTITSAYNRDSVVYSSNDINNVRTIEKAFSTGAPTGYQLQVYSVAFSGARTLIKSFTQTQNGITNYWASDWTKVSGNETWLGYDVLVKPTTPPPPPAGPWWQTKDADVQSSGNLTSNIPQQCVASSQCTEQFGLTGDGGYPGVPAASGTTAFGQGTPNPRNWDVEGSPYTGRRYDYSYFASLAPPTTFTDPSSVITDTQINGGNLVSGYQSGGYVWRYRNGDLTINQTATIGNNKTILFVNGNLTIGGRITLTKGQGFFGAIVKGNINISSSVTHTGQKFPENSGPGLEGIYLADGTINTGTTGTGDDQLYARGSLVGLDGVNLQRNLSGSDDDTHPAEFIEYAPDLVFTFPRDLLRQGIVWREIAP